MKEQFMYVCEVCGTAYEDADDALECENSHKELDYDEFLQEHSPDYKNPLYLTILNEDGEPIRYKNITEQSNNLFDFLQNFWYTIYRK